MCELELVLHSGERSTVRVDYHRGHWKNPMSDEDVAEKLRSLAKPMLPQVQIDALVDQLWALERVPDVPALIRLMVRPDRAATAPADAKRTSHPATV